MEKTGQEILKFFNGGNRYGVQKRWGDSFDSEIQNILSRQTSLKMFLKQRVLAPVSGKSRNKVGVIR